MVTPRHFHFCNLIDRSRGSQDPCNCGACAVPGVPNGALGGVSGGSKRGTSKGDVEGSWGKVSIELRGMGASLFSHGGKEEEGDI